MDENAVAESLQNIFREVFDDKTIILKPNMTANDIKEWDSFNHIRLIVTVEEQFNITMPTEDVMNLKTVGQLIDMISRYVSNAF